MTLPAPNLDDRTFKDILEEAVKRIPRHCPQWTDFNPSDPGITLLEMMAWMTEMIIYRLNRVPDKSYIKFLELMGVRLKPPQPARTWLVFRASEGAGEDDLPTVSMGTPVATAGSGDQRVVFETTRALNLTSTRLISAFSRYGEQYTEHGGLVGSPMGEGVAGVPGGVEGGVEIFPGTDQVPHVLYLGDDSVSTGSKYAALVLHLKRSQSLVGINVQWECWDGGQWIPIVPSEDSTAGMSRSGEILFRHLPELHLTEIPPHGPCWLRACLVGLQEERLPAIDQLKRSFQLKKEHGLMPGNSFLSTETVPYSPVDFNAIVYLFGKEPAVNNILYLGSHIFSRKNAMILLDIKMSESYSPPALDFIKKLEIHWEYFSRKGVWETLGVTAVTGVKRSEHSFADETDAFTKSGKISFHCPPEIDFTVLHGVEDHWIRVRIVEGNYGTNTLHPPQVKDFRITYREDARPFGRYIGYNYFTYSNLTESAVKKESFEPFEIHPEQSPAFYMAFNRPFSNKTHRVYFPVERSPQHAPVEHAPVDGGGPGLYWEYSCGGEWKKLKIDKDTTVDFSHSGCIEFIGPPDWGEQEVFNRRGYWLRVRREGGDTRHPPRLSGIYLNAVEARQCTTLRDEILGSGNGRGGLEFAFSRPPLPGGMRILVREPGEDGETPGAPGEEIWRTWEEVENFLHSGPDDRHYTLDPYHGAIVFGDGRRGKVPPQGRDNIKCGFYYTGGGARGNVGAHTLTILEAPVPYVDSVTNPGPASGGADAEKIEDARLRGPWLLKHRDRAVTGEDFEKLALEASGEVARAWCYKDRQGTVKIVIIPVGEEQKLLPRTMLVEQVRRYLDQRRLLTTRIDVLGPLYVDVSVEAEVVPLPTMSHSPWEIKAGIEEQLNIFLHPLKGGPYGSGWPMGRNVYISELYYLLEKMPGVDYVKRLVMNGNRWLQRVDIDDMTFPYLTDVNIQMAGG